MSANELRQAANTLRHLAGQVTRHADGADLWFDGDVDLRNAIAAAFLGNKDSAWDDARWIALMSPTVGLALADWLEAIAISWVWDEHPDDVETPDGWPLTLEESIDTIPLKIARLINGGAA